MLSLICAQVPQELLYLIDLKCYVSGLTPTICGYKVYIPFRIRPLLPSPGWRGHHETTFPVAAMGK